MTESRPPQHTAAPARAASPGPEHARLGAFVGTWRTEGEILGAEAAATRLRATDSYEWLPGRYFLVHRVDGTMGDDEVQTLEIIGYDAERGSYFTHSFDNQGNVAEYEARLTERAWSIEGASERFTGAFREDWSELEGTWERRDDSGDWTRWMTIRLVRAA